MKNPSKSTAPTTTLSSSAAATKTPCCSKVGLKRGPWKPEEDELLANYINKEGEGRWRTLPKRAGLLRCGKSCRLRWMNYLRPSVKRGQIAPDEEDLILRLHRLLGNRWSLIAGRIPGRTDNEIKNYWNTHLSKKLVCQGIDPRTHRPLNPDAQIEHQQQQKASSSKTNRKFSSSSSPKLAASTVSPVNPEESSSAGTGSSHQVINNNDINNTTTGYFHYANAALTTTTVSQLLNHQFNGYTSLLNGDTSAGMDLGSNNHHHRINHNQEDDEDINYCTDDVFSSFLNSLINEDAFAGQQHQILQQQQQQQTSGFFIPTSDPLVSISNSATSALGFGGPAGWESALMTSAFSPGDPSRIHDHHVDQ